VREKHIEARFGKLSLRATDAGVAGSSLLSATAQDGLDGPAGFDQNDGTLADDGALSVGTRFVDSRAGAVALRSVVTVRAGRFAKLAGGGWFRGVAKPRVVSRDRGKPPASHASRMALISAAICSSSLVRVLDVGMLLKTVELCRGVCRAPFTEVHMWPYINKKKKFRKFEEIDAHTYFHKKLAAFIRYVIGKYDPFDSGFWFATFRGVLADSKKKASKFKWEICIHWTSDLEIQNC
jgi:hypothetical protein